MIKIATLKPNPDNPRGIEEHRFQKLCDSIKNDPEFMPLNPLKIIEGGVIYAGNMRFRAIQHLGMTEIPDDWVKDISHLSEAKRRKYIMIDNEGFGFNDWDLVTSQYTTEELVEWGIEIPVDPIPEAEEEPPPESHGFKIKCEDLDELIELREMLNAEVDSKSMSYGNFKMIFKNRKDA